MKRDDSIIPESVWPKSGFSRKGRAYSLLLFVFEDDSLVLEFKNALECRRFGHYFQNIIADTTDVLQGILVNWSDNIEIWRLIHVL